MAPSTASPKPAMTTRSGSRVAAAPSRGREATPTAPKPGPVAVAKSNIELDSVFKTDLTNIRSLISCSICAQLLYEPWTLSCGHTYCYSCLCNWFVPNRRKKTCPECRDVVKQIPSPSFLIKQLVEIFIKRGELMPSDESTEQHEKKKAEEAEEVERDKTSQEGLFKGAFPPRNRDLIFDEQDGVLRCPRCLTEHEGGPTCTNCLLPVDNGYDFSDVDEDQFDADIDVEDLELDMDSVGGYHNHFGHFIGIPHFGFQHFPYHHHHHHHHHHGEDITSNSEDEDFFSGNSEDDDEDEDNSLQDFIVRDDADWEARPARNQNPAGWDGDEASNSANPITISDDDSDEGGPVRPRQPRRNLQATRNPRRSRPSVIELSSSEAGDLSEDATVLRNAGWSPLTQENDTDVGVSEDNYGYDTETVGDRDTEDEDEDGGLDYEDRSRSELSETPTTNYGYDHPTPSNASEEDYDERNDSEDGTPSVIDRDGDTEMSASPRPSRESRSPSAGGGQGHRYHTGATLGATTQVYNIEEDSSDDSVVVPAHRRRRGQASTAARTPRYDPRISLIFAEHQQNMRGVRDHHEGLGELDSEAPRVEPASRSRRRDGSRYRLPPRRGDFLRSPTYPDVDRVISSSMRAARSPRQYHRRN